MKFMGRFQKFIAAILLLSFGVPSLCGDGLHLVLGHFHGAHGSSACEKVGADRTASGGLVGIESAEGAEDASHDADGCPL